MAAGYEDPGIHQPCVGDGVASSRRVTSSHHAMAVDTGKGGFQVAQKITTLFIDDIDGGAAEGTVRFALDGTEYEIDLNAKHSEELRTALGKYVSHARKVGGAARRSGRTAGRAARGAGSVLNTTEIRTWARENGYDIKDRGRVPADLVAKYQAATGK
jgi:nucleoid-associated protein Lsr2